MIIFARSANVMPGKMGPAIAFANEIKQMVDKITGVKLTIMVPIGGNPNQIVWRTTYDNLAALEAVNDKLMGDAGYMKKLGDTAGMMVPGSIHDNIFRVLS